MKKPTVHLGFSVGAGEPVAVPIGHMAVTGMTQAAGKTTTLEALVERSGLRAVTFITKRGEGSFANGRRIPPFFRERADWVFVASLIDATLGEKNKLLRSWLMKVCRGTHTLAEVQRNVKEAQTKARGFAESIYTEIDGYLDLVVPQLAQLPPPSRIVIYPGLNVVDLSPYSTELQALVIKSFLEHIYEHEQDVITVIPEAWEFLPEGRGSPVKREAETLIRKGAALRNYVWLDSQDLAGVWKLAVRACPVYLIGVQREANEIKRTLENIPAGISKPSKADVATLANRDRLAVQAVGELAHLPSEIGVLPFNTFRFGCRHFGLLLFSDAPGVIGRRVDDNFGIAASRTWRWRWSGRSRRTADRQLALGDQHRLVYNHPRWLHIRFHCVRAPAGVELPDRADRAHARTRDASGSGEGTRRQGCRAGARESARVVSCELAGGVRVAWLRRYGCRSAVSADAPAPHRRVAPRTDLHPDRDRAAGNRRRG